MKYCPNCGEELPSGTKFCPSCGYKIEETPKAEPQTEVDQNAENEAQENVKTTVATSHSVNGNENVALNKDSGPSSKIGIKFNGDRKKWGILIGIVAVVLIIGIWFFKSPTYRNMSTSHDAKINQFDGWANNESMPISTTTTLDGKRFVMTPQNTGAIEQIIDAFTSDESTESQTQAQLQVSVKDLSSKVQHEWGSGYTVVVGDPNDNSQMLVEAKNGQITYPTGN